MSLKDYIQGNRQGKEANRLEREAMNDPFLQGALDGFDSVDGDHAGIIEQLEKKYTRPVAAAQPKKRKLFYWAAAASVLLLIGFGSYFLLEKESRPVPIFAEALSDSAESVTPAESLKVEPEYAKEVQQEPLIADNTIKKTPLLQKEIVTPLVAEDKVNSSPVDNKIAADAHSLSELMEKEPSTAEATNQEQTAQTVSGNDKTITLKPDKNALSEIVVKGYGTQERKSVVGSVASVSKKDSVPIAFGEKEFQVWCRQKAGKNACGDMNASVKVTFFIDESGKPSNIEYREYSCEGARDEMQKLLLNSPAWTKPNRKVTLRVKW